MKGRLFMSAKKKDRLLTAAGAIVCLMILMFFLFPYVYLVLSSFKPPHEVVTTSPSMLPSRWTVENYRIAFSQMPVGRYFGNSVIASAASTALAVFIGSMAAYGCSRLNSTKLAAGCLLITLAMRLIPMISVAIPMFGISIQWGMYDTLPFLIMFYTAFQLPFIIWMMSSYFKGVPEELEEAAQIDGCGLVRSFVSIILPVSKPGIATTTILSFLLPWNDFMFALFTTSRNAKTLPVGLSEFVTSYDINLAPMTAIATFFSIPIIIMTFYLQKYIVSGMTLGAVKG